MPSRRPIATARASSSRARRSTGTSSTAALAAFGDSVLVVGAPPALQGARAHRRPGRRAARRHRRGRDRRRRGERHARADRASASDGSPPSAPATSCSSREVPATARWPSRSAPARSSIADPTERIRRREQILAAIDGARAESVLVLPNDASAVLAAESAAAHAVATRARASQSLPRRGSRARSSRTCPTPTSTRTAPRWRRALAGVRSGEVSRAVRAASIDGVDVARATTSRSRAGGRSRRSASPRPRSGRRPSRCSRRAATSSRCCSATASSRAGRSLRPRPRSHRRHPGLEVAVHEGGQARPIALLAVE